MQLIFTFFICILETGLLWHPPRIKVLIIKNTRILTLLCMVYCVFEPDDRTILNVCLTSTVTSIGDSAFASSSLSLITITTYELSILVSNYLSR